MSRSPRRDALVVAAFAVAVTLFGAMQAEAADAPTLAAASLHSPTSSTTSSSTTSSSTTTTAPPEHPVDAAFRRWFPEVETRAREIAWCESRHDPRAVSRGGGNHGLFQINRVHRTDFQRVTGAPFYDGVYDPDLNARFARWLYDRQGWRPWACA